jgi:hypothetical protein
MTPDTRAAIPVEAMTPFAMTNTLARLAQYCRDALHLTAGDTIAAELQRYLESHALHAPAELVLTIARYTAGELPSA